MNCVNIVTNSLQATQNPCTGFVALLGNVLEINSNCSLYVWWPIIHLWKYK